MLDSIITSKTRLAILLRFFMSGERSAYLRELANEIGDSTNSVRIELNRLTQAQIIECYTSGRSKMYRANKQHPLFPDLHSIVKKTLGIDKLVVEIINCLGDVQIAGVTGDYALGIDSGIIDLVLVGEINRDYLEQLIQKTEPLISHRKIRYLCLSCNEYEQLKRKLEKEGFLEIYTKTNVEAVDK